MAFLRRAFAEPKAAHRLMLAIVALMVVANALWGERVSAGGGLGWDGVTYARLARELDTLLRDDTLGSYYAQRLLPSLIVREALLLGRAALDDANIITGFVVLNGLLCLALAGIWRRTCDTLALGVQARWVGFTALFVNFQLSKQSMFYPVLTDVAALVLSALLLLLYLRRSRVGVTIAGIVGAFCWPTLGLTAALLVLLMPEAPGASPAPPTAAPRFVPGRKIAFAAAALLAAVVVLISPAGHALCTASGLPAALVGHLPAGVAAALARNGMLADPCLLAQQGATALPALALLGIAILLLCRPSLAALSLRRPSAYRLQSIAFAIAVLAVSWAGVRWLSNPAVANPSGIAALVRAVLLPPAGKVFLPFVSVAVFWGPCLLFLALSWSRMSAEARRLGPAIIAVLAVTLPFVLVGEPRFLVTIWPILALLSAILLGDAPRRPVLVLLAASLLLAQFWLPLNAVPWDNADYDDLLRLPKQLYFMHYGLWMGWPAYLAQGTLLIVLAAVLWRWRARVALPQEARRDPAERAG